MKLLKTMPRIMEVVRNIYYISMANNVSELRIDFILTFLVLNY